MGLFVNTKLVKARGLQQRAVKGDTTSSTPPDIPVRPEVVGVFEPGKPRGEPAP